MSHKKGKALLLYMRHYVLKTMRILSKKYIDIHDINSRNNIHNKYIYIYIYTISNFNLLIANILTSIPKKKFQ